MKSPRFRLPRSQWLFAIAFVLCVLACHPTTRQLVRTQIGAIFTAPVRFEYCLQSNGQDKIVPTKPVEASPYVSGYQQTLGFRLTFHYPEPSPFSCSRVVALRELTAEYPNNPEIYAHILRLSTVGDVMVKRPEGSLLVGETRKPSELKKSDPAAINAYCEDADAGKTADPYNAYFPMMQAIGRYAQNYDSDAIAALHRAAMKPHWEDYAFDEPASIEAYYDALGGRETVLEQALTQYSVLFPHFSQLREVARIATYQAAEMEKQGKFEEARQIRHDLMQCGALMRVQSRSIIGSLVGIAISQIAMSRPGGAPYVKPPNIPSDKDGAERTKLRTDAYCTYLRQHKFDNEAEWVRQQSAEDIRIKSLIVLGRERPEVNATDIFVLPAWWGADLLLLGTAISLLCFGCAAALSQKKCRGKQFLAFGILLSGTGFLLFSLARWLAAFENFGIDLTRMVLGDSSGMHYSAAANRLEIVLLMLTLPMWMVPCFAVSAKRTRGPGFAGIANGFARHAAPTAYWLIVLYCGTSLMTARLENQVSHDLTRIQQHEGRYFAELVGQTWDSSVVPEQADKKRVLNAVR